MAVPVTITGGSCLICTRHWLNISPSVRWIAEGGSEAAMQRIHYRGRPQSPEFFKEVTRSTSNLLPNSRKVPFERHGHVAINTVAELFVETVIDYALE